MYSININPNYTTVNRQGAGSVTTNASAKVASSAIAANANKSSSGNIQISFECYNVMSFVVNNPEMKINFRIFTEFGEEHPITKVEKNRYATVQSVSYDLSGAVIKANVEATLVFNDKKEVEEKSNQEAAATETASGDNKYKSTI
jgi:hypothetical protein